MSPNKQESSWSSELDDVTLDAVTQILHDDPDEADVQSTLANVVVVTAQHEAVVDVLPNSNKPETRQSKQRQFAKLGWLGLAVAVLLVMAWGCCCPSQNSVWLHRSHSRLPIRIGFV